MSKNNNRVAVTLRFPRKDIQLMQAIFQRTVGHSDIKKGCKDVIVNVMRAAVKEIRSEQEEAIREQQGNSGNSRSNTEEIRVQPDTDSDVVADEKDTMVDSGTSEGTSGQG